MTPDQLPAPHQNSGPSNEALPTLPPRSADVAFERYDRARLPDATTARDVAALFERIYDDRYLKAALRHPELYREEVLKGTLLSIVARDRDGSLAGHVAVLPFAERSVELGMLVVRPEERGRGLGRFLLAEALTLGRELAEIGIADTIVNEFVTSHTLSQHLLTPYGFKPTGIFDRKYTDFFGKGYRESVVRVIEPAAPALLNERTVFLPARYHSLARWIYDGLHCGRTIADAGEAVPRNDAAARSMFVDCSELPYFEALTVRVGAERSASQVAKDAVGTMQFAVPHLSFRLDLAHPNAVEQADTLRALGFYFAAIEPGRSTDFLVLQRPHRREDTLFPHIASILHPGGEEILRMIREAEDGS